VRLSILAALFLGSSALADETGFTSAFGPGEQSSYVLTYLGVPAGEFEVTVGMLMRRDEHDVWPILCTAKSQIPVFIIDDKYVSYWDPKERMNVGSDFWINENRKKRREHVRYSRPEKKAYVKRGGEDGELKQSVYDITQQTVDVAGASFWLRNVPLKAGGHYELPVFTGAVAFKMTADVDDKTKITTALRGEQSVWKIHVGTEFTGQLKAKRDIVVYLSADDKQTIERVEADFLLGLIQADLVHYEPGRDFTHG
jgi:hypothetical protein